MADYNYSKGDIARKVETAAKKLESSAKSMEDTGTEKAGKTWDSMKKMADDIRNVSLDKYKSDMMDRVDDAKVSLDKNVDNVKIGIQDHPFESIAIAAGAGVLVGAIIALMGRRSERTRT